MLYKINFFELMGAESAFSVDINVCSKKVDSLSVKVKLDMVLLQSDILTKSLKLPLLHDGITQF